MADSQQYDIINEITGAAPQPPSAPQSGAERAPGGDAAPPTVTTPGGSRGGASLSPSGSPVSPAAGPQPRPDEGFLGNTATAVATGALEAFYETKDFLVGEPSQGEKSYFRRQVEADRAALAEKGWGYSVVSSISQFATGMIGAGKLIKGAQAIPYAADALGFLAPASKAGRAAVEIGKAASVGAVVFDPHEERLSNLIVNYLPDLANPVVEYLAADPNDSDAEGRLKGALESIGMDLTVLSVFGLGLKGLRALRHGDTATVEKVASEIEAQQKNAPEPTGPDTGGGNGSASPGNDGGGPVATPKIAQAPAGQPVKEALGGPAERLALREPTDAELALHLAKQADDAEAIMANGSRQGAAEAGHAFGEGDFVPWQRFKAGAGGYASTEAVNAWVARVTDAYEADIIRAKGGNADGVLTDAAVQRMIRRRVQVYNEDPEALVAALQKAGKDAKKLAADLGASDLITQRMFQDAYLKAQKINNGFLEDWGGSAEAAQADLKETVGWAMAAFSAARSISTSAGRTLRRSRGDFAPSPEALASLRDVDGAKLAGLLANTGGDPRRLAKAMQPKLIKKAIDVMGYMYVNNVLSGWMTQVRNIVGNTFAIVAGPSLRIGGSWAQSAVMGVSKVPGFLGGSPVRRQAVQEYRFMLAAMMDSFNGTWQAIKTGDSVLTPHEQKIEAGPHLSARDVAQTQFVPISNMNALVYDMWLGTLKLIGIPTRVLGGVDELGRQTIYRSRVAAKASVEAEDLGLQGKARDDYIDRQLSSAFGPNGEALDAEAIQRAREGVFAQQLSQGQDTWGGTKPIGQSLQNFAAAHPLSRPVLTFIRAPVNLFKFGMDMTPGLAFLRREAWSVIGGKRGPEAQADLIGRQMIGTVITGLTAAACMEGRLTGGGPGPGPARNALWATGWRPYSLVTVNEDGSRTYVPLGNYDPISLPLSITADICEIAAHPDRYQEAESLAAAASIAFVNILGNRTYLTGFRQVVDALGDPNNRMTAYLRGLSETMVPFSSGLKAMNPDPYLRDVRSMVDAVKSTLPGVSEDLPPRYDIFGDPQYAHYGPSVGTSMNVVDEEIARLAIETGSAIPQAGPIPPGGLGVDLRKVKTDAGSDAYSEYQHLAGHPPGMHSLKQVIYEVMHSAAYLQSFDGKVSERGSRLDLLSKIVSDYRRAGMGALMAQNKSVRDAVMNAGVKQIIGSGLRGSPTAITQRAAKGIQDLGAAFGIQIGTGGGGSQ